MTEQPKTVLAVLYNGLTLLDFIGPYTVMTITNKYKFSTVALGAKEERHVVDAKGLHLTADYSYETVPHHEKYDVILIPGGPQADIQWAVKSHVFIAQLKNLCSRAKLVFSICTGAALLAHTGILDGKNATTNKTVWDWVVEQRPEPIVHWIKERRWVDAGDVLTAAGVSAGIDGGCYLLTREFGAADAYAAARIAEYRWENNPVDWEWGPPNPLPQQGQTEQEKQQQQQADQQQQQREQLQHDLLRQQQQQQK